MAAAGYLSQDTIAAVATALGGPIAIVRISGPRAREALYVLTGRESFRPRELACAELKSREGATLDSAMAVYFPNPESFTGEDVCELHLHGGSFGVSAVLEELFRLGIRQALPGEFSFRAVRNGKLALDQAYAIADLITAQNSGAVSLALAKLSGLQSELTCALGESVRTLVALSEAGIDFSDQDLEEVSLRSLKKRLEPVVKTLRSLAESHERGLRIQEGVSVAFVGCPNAGKSSFFNALLGEDRSIVSSAPGTTRDVIRERLTLRDHSRAVTLRLEDTAGLRSSTDEVERIGIARSLEAARNADLVLFVFDATAPHEPARREWEALRGAVPSLVEKTLGILAKTDLLPEGCQAPAPFPLSRWVPTSAQSGAGISEAVQSIIDACDRWTRRGPGEVLLTRREQLESAKLALSHMLRAAEAEESDLFAADLRQALAALAPLIGDTLPEDVLTRIFSDFCIGK